MKIFPFTAVEFDDLVFTQLCGVAKGNETGPSIGYNLYTVLLRRNLTNECK